MARLTREHLRKIIKEELGRIVNEVDETGGEHEYVFTVKLFSDVPLEIRKGELGMLGNDLTNAVMRRQSMNKDAKVMYDNDSVVLKQIK